MNTVLGCEEDRLLFTKENLNCFQIWKARGRRKRRKLKRGRASKTDREEDICAEEPSKLRAGWLRDGDRDNKLA